MAAEPRFEVTVPSDHRPGDTLVVGISTPGLAGLTAVDYLVRHLESDPIGAVVPRGMPAIAPFENGVPRHPTRVYDLSDTPLAVLVSELFVPPWVAEPFVEATLDWAAAAGIEEVVVLHGVPFPHREEEHTVFHVATDEYRERRLSGDELPPLAGGVLDGVPGELVVRGLTPDATPVGVFVTPTHPPGPDVDAALRLIDAVEGRYGFDVDEAELLELAERLEQYYAEMADRMEALGQAEQPLATRDFPEDRMYM